MSQVSFEVDFECHERLLNIPRFAPGSTVHGVYRLTIAKPIRCRSAELRFGWHTEGKGDRDEGIIESRPLSPDALVPGRTLSDRFIFTLPHEPWSYSGHYISIVWSVSVWFDYSLRRDITEHAPFIMAPD